MLTVAVLLVVSGDLDKLVTPGVLEMGPSARGLTGLDMEKLGEAN